MLEALKDDPRLDHVEEGKAARGYTVHMRLPRRETEQNFPSLLNKGSGGHLGTSLSRLSASAP